MGYIGSRFQVYWGSIWIVEKDMETTILQDLGFSKFRA